jgi:hypothetical protein
MSVHWTLGNSGWGCGCCKHSGPLDLGEGDFGICGFHAEHALAALARPYEIHCDWASATVHLPFFFLSVKTSPMAFK